MKNLVLTVFTVVIIVAMSQHKVLAQEFHGNNTPPAYKGGNKALKEFINKSLIYPDSIKKAGISGTVVVSMLINEDGTTEDVKLMRGIHEVCDAEAVRVARLLQDWEATERWGKPSSCHVLLPIEFSSEYNHMVDQSVIVTGVITDKSTGKPVEGILILIKGTNTGTLSSADGRYKLETPGENFELEITSSGYVTKTEPIGKNRTINVELDTDYQVINYLEN